MTKLLISIYRYFHAHRVALWLCMVVSTVVMAAIASQLRFSGDITDFLPRQSSEQSLMFKNLKTKDKIIVDISARDADVDPNLLIEAGEAFSGHLFSMIDSSYVVDYQMAVSEQAYSNTLDYIFSHLPLFVAEEDYARVDSLLSSASGVDDAVRASYQSVISSASFGQSSVILSDPLGLSGRALDGLRSLNTYSNIIIYNNYLFSEDLLNLYFFINSSDGGNASKRNDRLISAIEDSFRAVEAEFDGVRFFYYGSPAVATYNARQIQRDLMVTLNFALLIIMALVLFTFRRKRSLLLIIVPVVYGALFSLSCIYFISGSISSIAIGAGSIVLGIAMSYSIHALSTTFSCRSVEQAISELAVPLTIGSFTTIGAFIALVFTSSPLLGDFGLFASLSLVGSAIFCLVFLPHFIHYGDDEIHRFEQSWWFHINNYKIESNRIIIGLILGITVYALFNYSRVEFDYDMDHLNYQPPHLTEGLERVRQMSNDDVSTLTISSGATVDQAVARYRAAADSLSQLHSDGCVRRFSSVAGFLLDSAGQQAAIDRWNRFWTADRVARLERSVASSAAAYGFRPGSFDGFFRILRSRYVPADLPAELLSEPNILGSFVEQGDDNVLLLSQVWVNDSDAGADSLQRVYDSLGGNATMVDRSFYISMIARSVSDDFNFILFISSILIFVVLYLSYGRLELTLLAFTPMLLSWIIIIGLMPLLGIKFNIINIILSTFIFGIGDDFSIFVLDGLTARYRNGRSTIVAHKSAILLSAIVTVVGMAALIFARHPAIYSLSLISLLGISVVVVISYTLQPFLYNLLITRPARLGMQPVTLRCIFRSLSPFLTFLLSCFVISVITLLLMIVPVGSRRRRRISNALIRFGSRATLFMAFGVRSRLPRRLSISRPSVVIANHQSFVDILVMLSIVPRPVIVSKSWVWNSPFFGFIIRRAGFLHASGGLDSIVSQAGDLIREGYSIVIFPEGTRSPDLAIHRFHKGAFMLAERLEVDVVPVVLHGNGYVLPKLQTLVVRRGVLTCLQLDAVPFDHRWADDNYRAICDRARSLIREGYDKLHSEFFNTSDPYLRDRLRHNYSFKGLVAEQYMNVKLSLEHYYRAYDEFVPRRARVYDVGCGYGAVSCMLAMVSDDREVVGVDYDADKVDLISHSALRPANATFVAADVRSFEFGDADVFLFSDSLHYLRSDEQLGLLGRCAARLRPGGFIIIRDGNSCSSHHSMTRVTEFLSTRFMRFNKTTNDLSFISSDFIREAASRFGLSVSVVGQQKSTSNTTYILRLK